MEEENGRQNVIYSELFQKQWPKKTASTSCRYLLKQIKDHTYIVNDKTVLEDVEERFEDILQIMKIHCPSDFGFLVNSSLEKPVNEKRSNSNYEKLPHPRLRKSKFTGRVGRSNEWRKFHSKISVEEDKTPLPECIEETIPADDNALFDIKFEETGDQMMHSNNYLDEENGDTKPFLEEIVNDVNEHKNIENDCILTKINYANIKNKKTTRKPKFSREEKSNILNNKMLSDESIDLAQQLLKKQFPMFGGLQDIALSEHYGLDVVKKDKPFIQVLYNGSVHWIGYVYLILIETGLKTILAIFWILYLEVKLQKMLRTKYVPYYSARNLS